MVRECMSLTGGTTCCKAWGKLPGMKNKKVEPLGTCPIPPVYLDVDGKTERSGSESYGFKVKKARS